MRLKQGNILSIIDDSTLKVSVKRYIKWPKVNKLVLRKRNVLVHTGTTKDWKLGEVIGLKPIAKVSKRKSHLAIKLE